MRCDRAETPPSLYCAGRAWAPASGRAGSRLVGDHPGGALGWALGYHGGVFAQRGHSARTAPIITVIIQVTTLKTTPPCGIMHNQFKTQKFKHLMLAMGPRDLNSAPYSPVHCSSHSMTSFQSSELTELPVVENSQLFAQRAHSARYAPQYVTTGGLTLCRREPNVIDSGLYSRLQRPLAGGCHVGKP